MTDHNQDSCVQIVHYGTETSALCGHPLSAHVERTIEGQWHCNACCRSLDDGCFHAFKAPEPHSDDQSSAKRVEDLLPCPFCGWDKPQLRPAEISEDHELIESPFVQCLECGTIGPPDDDGDDLHAIKLWNRRAPPAASPSVECPTCSFNADPGCQRCRTPPAAPPQKELLDALIAASKMCGSCRGSGRYSPHCYKCDDSGEEHIDCPPERDCGYPTCIATRAAITAAKESR